VVLGEQVKISPVAIAHHNLRIQIREDAPVEERDPAEDNAPVTPEQALRNSQPEKIKKKVSLPSLGSSVADIVTSLNEVGATPDDLVFVMQSLKSAGALVAEIELQ
jgi:flagellar P-ring protein precursor FlgI